MHVGEVEKVGSDSAELLSTWLGSSHLRFQSNNRSLCIILTPVWNVKYKIVGKAL